MDHTPKDDRQLTIEHHIDAAHLATSLASSLLTDAAGPCPDEVTAEDWVAARQHLTATAAAAAQVADAHTRLLELKLAIGAPEAF